MIEDEQNIRLNRGKMLQDILVKQQYYQNKSDNLLVQLEFLINHLLQQVQKKLKIWN